MSAPPAPSQAWAAPYIVPGASPSHHPQSPRSHYNSQQPGPDTASFTEVPSGTSAQLPHATRTPSIHFHHGHRSGRHRGLDLTPRRFAPWRQSNAVWDCLTTHIEPPEQRSAPTTPAPAPSLCPGLVEQLPSASNTWDWFSHHRPYPQRPRSFIGGSALLAERAQTCDTGSVRPTQNPAIVAARDPILEGDINGFKPSKRFLPMSQNLNWSTSDQLHPPRASRKAGKPAYDPTRAGVRTDREREIRPAVKQMPKPPSWTPGDDVEEQRKRHPHANADRSRDIILQLDDEFVHDMSGGIRTFPRHLRQSEGESLDQYRPYRRILGNSHPESAERVMHYNLPRDEATETLKAGIHDKNNGSGASVIQYRHSEGICPRDRVMRDTRPSRRVYEHELKVCYDRLQETHQMYLHNQSRANHGTSIY